MKSPLPFAVSLYVTLAAATLYSEDRVQFEVASVKPNAECVIETSVSPGGVALKGVPMKILLMEAFKVGADRINGPSWIESVCFDVFARLPQGGSTAQIPLALQALLADRFKLNARKEGRPGTGYSLVVDKNGPKMKESTESSNFMRGRAPSALALQRDGAGIKGAMSIELLVKYLSRAGYGPVEDATGLKGKYEVDLSWVADPAIGSRSGAVRADGAPAIAEASAPTADLFSAVRQSLGLRLEPHKATIEFLVIERLERVPTEN
jgi:uncharacterized protein (TIGR03435 family)